VPVNATTAALLLLLLVLGTATRWGLKQGIVASVAAMLVFNFFFLPPVYTFTISDPQNWIALFAFLVTAVTASQLSAQAKRRAEEAVAGRNELSQLYELSKAMLMDETHDAINSSVVKTGQILSLTNITFFDAATGRTYGTLKRAGGLQKVATTGEPLTDGDVTVIPVRLGTRIVGSLGLQGAPLSPTLQDSVASLLAINYERVRALDRAAAAEVSKRNERFKSSLLDGLAHDLKTPLTAIRTCVTRLITIPPRTEEVRQELLSIIDQESERLQASITDAIQLARIESEELHLNREPTNAADLIYRAIEDTRDENRGRYKIDVPNDIAFNVDADLIRRALLQVIENARKYAPPDSEITIHADRDSISISDRGPGIHPDDIDRVFDKFYRGRAESSSVEGTGMGLAIARAIVEEHGGAIDAFHRQGGGATITLNLPR
jgi:two-component system sensor histidine kinase KdpD